MTCRTCGKSFQAPHSKRKFCSNACSNRAPRKRHVREDHPMWKGDAATHRSKRYRAKRWHKLGDCERCGQPALDRHHKNGNLDDNSPENIASLCRRCHMEVDGRLESFKANHYVQPIVPPKPCIECGELAKPTRRGLCGRCYERHRREARKQAA